jgi:hypothetical protein
MAQWGACLPTGSTFAAKYLETSRILLDKWLFYGTIFYKYRGPASSHLYLPSKPFISIFLRTLLQVLSLTLSLSIASMLLAQK